MIAPCLPAIRRGVVALLAGAALIIAPEPAAAYKFLPSHPFPTGKIRYYDGSTYHWAVRRAAAIWNRSGVRVHFTRTSRPRANLIIRTFGARPRPDTISDGCAGTALGRRPVSLITTAGGCFDGVLTSTAIAHEMGHILGLAHETRRCAVMNPVVVNFAPGHCRQPPGGFWRCRTLELDDLRGAARLYGGHPRLEHVNPMCPVFAALRAVARFAVSADGYGVVTARWRSAPRPGVLGRVYPPGVVSDEPLVLRIGRRPGSCASAPRNDASAFTDAWRGPDRPAKDVSEIVGEGGLASGTYCFAIWIQDRHGRRGPMTLRELSVVASGAPPPSAPPPSSAEDEPPT